MAEHVCPLCQNNLTTKFDTVTDVETRHVFSVLHCSNCDLGITAPVPDNLDKYYSQAYHGGRHGFTTRLCDSRRLGIVHALSSSERSKTLLDYGCGEGTFLHAASRAGWNIYGVEKFPERAREIVPNVCTTLDEAEFDGPYDCITLWHSLEHLVDLVPSIRKLSSLLSCEGVLVVAVPNASGYAARWFGHDWLHLDVPRHLHHFSTRSLVRLLTPHGFRVQRLRCSEFEYDLMGWAQSWLTRCGDSNRSFFKLMSGRPTGFSKYKNALMIAAGMIACLVGAIPVFIFGRLGLGDTIIIAARKISVQETHGDAMETPDV